MPKVNISAKGTIATVTASVDLAEWGGKYPNDKGVLTAAGKLIDQAYSAIGETTNEIDNEISALQQRKVDLEQIKPSVEIDPDVVNVSDVVSPEVVP